MPKTKLIDAFYLSLLAPSGLLPVNDVALRRALHGRRFLTGLRQAVAAFLRRYPTLRSVRVTISR